MQRHLKRSAQEKNTLSPFQSARGCGALDVLFPSPSFIYIFIDQAINLRLKRVMDHRVGSSSLPSNECELIAV